VFSFSGNTEFLNPGNHITIGKSHFPLPFLGLYKLGAVNLWEWIESQYWSTGDFRKSYTKCAWKFEGCL